MAEDRRVEEKRRNELTLPTRLGRQDKASCLAAGTSFLSICLHIIFARLGLGRWGAAGALPMLSSLFPTGLATSLAMSGMRETEALTLM